MATNDIYSIMELEGRVSALGKAKILAFVSFCAQAAQKNLDVYERSVHLASQAGFKKLIDDWCWSKLKNRELSFPYKYEDVEEEFIDASVTLSKYPQTQNISPYPSSAMMASAIYIFTSTCSFLAGHGNVRQFLNVVDNCALNKVDMYYNFALKMEAYVLTKDGIDKYCGFPSYKHAVSDLIWVLDLLEQDNDENVSIKTLNMLQIYAKNSESFVVPVPMYID